MERLQNCMTTGVDEILWDVLVESLCNIAWTLGKTPLELQTGMVVSIYKKGDRRRVSVIGASESSASGSVEGWLRSVVKAQTVSIRNSFWA